MLEALCFEGSKEDPCEPRAMKEKGEVQKDKYNKFLKKTDCRSHINSQFIGLLCFLGRAIRTI